MPNELISDWLTEESFLPHINAIDITNDYMFAYIMQNSEICISLLEYLLPNRKISRVKYYSVDGEMHQPTDEVIKPETQKSMSNAFDKRGVRLDAYLDDGKTIYNIEMQTAMQPALAKRARLYQAHIDVNQLQRGIMHDQLRPSYVIFLCKFDPFGKGLYRYSIKSTCTEDASVDFQDETHKLFFSTVGTVGDIPKPLKELLTYMNDTANFPVEEVQNPLIHQIEEAVSFAKKDDDWRQIYMTHLIHQRDAEIRGEQRGEEKGIAIGKQLALKDTVLAMLQNHMPIRDIAKFTSLSVEQIEKLVKTLMLS